MLPKQNSKTGYYLLYMFLLGLFLGILAVNIRHDVWINDNGLLNAEMMRRLQESEPDGSYLFGYIIKHRLSAVLIVGLLASTVIGPPIVYAYVCYLGAGAGCMLSVAVIRYGVRGLLFMAAAIFPHGLILIPAYLFLFMWSMDLNRTLYPGTIGLDGHYYHRGRLILQKTVKLTGILILVVAGCMLESYVNLKILHLILEIF